MQPEKLYNFNILLSKIAFEELLYLSRIKAFKVAFSNKNLKLMHFLNSIK